MSDTSRASFPFLTKATIILSKLGWAHSTDEVGYPIFTQNINGMAVTILYQAFERNGQTDLPILVNGEISEINRIYGYITDSRFQNVTVRKTRLDYAVTQISRDLIETVHRDVVQWAAEESAESAIDRIASTDTVQSEQTIRRICALILQGDARAFENFLENIELPAKVTNVMIERANDLIKQGA